MTTNINLNILTNKINDLYDEAFNTIFTIIKNNEENIIKTNNYYLVDLDNVSSKTLTELQNYIDYLDSSYNFINNDENEKNKLKMELKQIETT